MNKRSFRIINLTGLPIYIDVIVKGNLLIVMAMPPAKMDLVTLPDDDDTDGIGRKCEAIDVEAENDTDENDEEDEEDDFDLLDDLDLDDEGEDEEEQFLVTYELEPNRWCPVKLTDDQLVAWDDLDSMEGFRKILDMYETIAFGLEINVDLTCVTRDGHKRPLLAIKAKRDEMQ